MRDQRGTTVTELMIVAAIVGILAASSIPILGTLFQDQKTRSAAEVVVQTLRAARQDAIATTAIYRVVFSSNQIQTLCTDNTPPGNACPPNRPPDSTVSSELDGATLNATPSEMRFDPKGAVLTGPGFVTVTYPSGQTWRVEVNTPGRVRACQGSSPCPTS